MSQIGIFQFFWIIEKKKEHNILNARRKSEKRLQVSQYKKEIGCSKYKKMWV